MEAISKINLPELALLPNEELSLAVRSGPPLPEGMGLVLAQLMAEAQAAKPNQVLPEGTPDMYLVQWEEMALRYGLPMFRDGLTAALRASRFFPDPVDIAERCSAIAKERGERQRAARFIREQDELKAQCEAEREEERIHGKPEPTETEKRLNVLLAQARERKANPPYHGPPALVLTVEQIKERVARERGELP